MRQLNLPPSFPLCHVWGIIIRSELITLLPLRSVSEKRRRRSPLNRNGPTCVILFSERSKWATAVMTKIMAFLQLRKRRVHNCVSDRSVLFSHTPLRTYKSGDAGCGKDIYFSFAFVACGLISRRKTGKPSIELLVIKKCKNGK